MHPITPPSLCCRIQVLAVHPTAFPVPSHSCRGQPSGAGWTSCPPPQPSEARLLLLPNLTLQPLPPGTASEGPAPSHLSCSQILHEMLQPRPPRWDGEGGPAVQQGVLLPLQSTHHWWGRVGCSRKKISPKGEQSLRNGSSVCHHHAVSSSAWKLQAARDETASAFQD